MSLCAVLCFLSVDEMAKADASASAGATENNEPTRRRR